MNLTAVTSNRRWRSAKRRNGTRRRRSSISFATFCCFATPATISGNYRRRLYFTLKFQQLTGPVMAKGLEDTTCYVYNRFMSVNDVGGTPAAFGVCTDGVPSWQSGTRPAWPHSMLATSTHDTKRSEDVRARLNVLSELPRAWAALVMRWRRLNRKHKCSSPTVVPFRTTTRSICSTKLWWARGHCSEGRKERSSSSAAFSNTWTRRCMRRKST